VGDRPIGISPIGRSKHLDDISFNNASGGNWVEVREQYVVIELQAEYVLNQRWSVMGSLPYLSTNAWIDNSLNSQLASAGDPWIMVRHMLFSSDKTGKSAFNHRLTLGSGLKFPLGNTTLKYEGESIPFDMQPGSVSYDLLASLDYLLRWKSIGFSVAGVYKYNGENLSEYRFGNTMQMNVQTFALLKNEKRFLMPFAGLYYEYAAQDWHRKEEISETGGDVLFMGAGAEIGSNKLSFRCSLQKGIHDHLKNSNVPARWRYTAGIQFYFRNKTK
jgi:hypothetical protein